MNSSTFSLLISELSFGKRVRNDHYIHYVGLSSCPQELQEFVEEVRSLANAGEEYNVIKFSPVDYKVSLLSYPTFFENPHPELRSSISVNLRPGKITRHDYTSSDNPPILHRKEAMLPPLHPLAEEFDALTREEEAHGLYNTKRVIGFKKNWDFLLAEKGLGYFQHKLISIEPSTASPEEVLRAEIHRHKTAIARYKFSRPIQTLLKYGLLLKDTSLLDFGCGQGDDIRGLREMGFSASGWDPVYNPLGPKEASDIVNLGFVLNVIEDPLERMEVLHEAYDLCTKLLVVSTLIATSGTGKLGLPYKDGIITSRKTFQKYFRQDELELYIEDVLHASAVAMGLGIFYVFRSQEEQQRFLSNRTRRSVNWMEISNRICPAKEANARCQKASLYDQNKDLLDTFWASMLELGRIPLQREFGRYDELLRMIGSAKKARSLYIKRFGAETLTKAFDLRRNDLQVYIALSHFRKKLLLEHLPESLRVDIKTFLGPYKTAIEESQALLFSAGNPEIITKLCNEAPFGFLDHQALFIHRSLVQEMHPVLRIYVGCAEVLYGDLRDVDIIKIHKKSGKVSLFKYDDFKGKPLPELQERIKVNLRRQSIEVFDHRSMEKQEILYFKERYVAENHPKREAWEEFSKRLQDIGLDLITGYGPSKQELLFLLESRGMAINLEQQESSAQLSEQE